MSTSKAMSSCLYPLYVHDAAWPRVARIDPSAISNCYRHYQRNSGMNETTEDRPGLDDVQYALGAHLASEESVPPVPVPDPLTDMHAYDSPVHDSPWSTNSLQPEAEICIDVTDSQFQCIVHPARMNELLRMRAGPGSGKTFTMVARIAQLLKTGALPEEVLVLSMANKSVDSLRLSLQEMVGPDVAARVEVSTFHSFCGGLLDQYGPGIIPNHTKLKTFDTKTWKKMITIFSSKSIKFDGHAIGASITPTKFGNMLTRIYSGKSSINEAVAPFGLNEKYIERVIQYLSQTGFTRFDELIGHAIYMMNRAKFKADASQAMPRLANYKYVMVDEFQDIYPLLLQIIKTIVSYPTVGCEPEDKKHLTIAGDPNQSIYGFLGSNHTDMENISDKIHGYKVKDILIPESFRCTQEILDGASRVCLQDDKTGLVTVRPYTISKPVIFHANSELMEQKFVANEIIRLVCQSGGLIRLGDIAILTRSNDSALSIQSLLKTSYKIPSVKLSQGNLWIETSLHLYKDVLSVISGDSDSSFSLMSVMQHMDRNRGSGLRVAKIFNRSMQDASPQDPLFLEAHLFEELSKIEEKSDRAQSRSRASYSSYIEGLYKNHPEVVKTLVQFLNMVQYERSYISEVRQRGSLAYGPVELVEGLARIAQVIGIPDTSSAESAQARKATMREALESFNNSLHHSYSKYVANDEVHTQSFLDYFLQTYDQEVPEGANNCVRISTIHSAKGLEFPVVFILGQTQFSSYWDNILAAPMQDMRPSDQDSPLREVGHEVIPSDSNARLLYVAMTRARNLLYLGCRKRYEELSHVTQAFFTQVLPDLRSHSKKQVVSQEQESPAGQKTPEILPNKEVEQGSLSCSQDVCVDEAKTSHVASSCHEQPRSHQTSVLQAIAYDLKRGVPTQQKMDLGASYFQSFSEMRKSSTPSQASATRQVPEWWRSANGIKQFRQAHQAHQDHQAHQTYQAHQVRQTRQFSLGFKRGVSEQFKRVLMHITR